MTMGKLKDWVRVLLSDTVEDYRWDDPYIYSSLIHGYRHLQNIRPESRYVNGKITDFVYPECDAKNPGGGYLMEEMETPVQDHRWDMGAVYYACSLCLERDNSDTANIELAEMYRQKAERIFLQ